jgi:hypothetical protein
MSLVQIAYLYDENVFMYYENVICLFCYKGYVKRSDSDEDKYN